MQKDVLVSIHNSGESLEKSIALIYNTLNKNFNFYSNYKIIIFYGHNLSKKVENFSTSAHGSIGFYQNNYLNENWCPECSNEYLWNNKQDILNLLINKKIISNRYAEKLYSNIVLYTDFISRLPFGYINSEFINKIINNSKEIFPNVEFIPIDLEKNYAKIYESLPKNKNIYSIYALENKCVIGHYDMVIQLDYRYDKRLQHLFKELGRKAVLSGNSAMFLASISYLTSDIDKTIGYRNHKYSRPNRDNALYEILKSNNGIIEPKNEDYNSYYDKVTSCNNMEEKSNEVVALAFKDYIKSNIKTLKLH